MWTTLLTPFSKHHYRYLESRCIKRERKHKTLGYALGPEEFVPAVVELPGVVPVDDAIVEAEGKDEREALRKVDVEESEVAPEVAEVAEVLVSAALDAAEAEEGETVPDPPAAVDSCANPTAGVPLLTPLLEEVVPRNTV